VRIYIGFDDTDDKDAPIGTGRLVRQFVHDLPETCRVVGVVRHQLPRLSEIPFTSNNSSACAIVEVGDRGCLDWLADLAVKHIHTHCAAGSNPGLCIADESAVADRMVVFGQKATGMRVTQCDAMTAARNLKLEGLGGSNDGIIGAVAAVGLTSFGWCGRFIEYGRLRDLDRDVTVLELRAVGIRVVSADRASLIPQPGDRLINGEGIHPLLWGGRPMLQVHQVGKGVWEPAQSMRGKKKKLSEMPPLLHREQGPNATPDIA